MAVGKMLNSHNGHMLAVKRVCHGCLRFILLVLPIACPPTYYDKITNDEITASPVK